MNLIVPLTVQTPPITGYCLHKKLSLHRCKMPPYFFVLHQQNSSQYQQMERLEICYKKLKSFPVIQGSILMRSIKWQQRCDFLDLT